MSGRAALLALLGNLALSASATAQVTDHVVPNAPSDYGRDTADEVPVELRPPTDLASPGTQWPQPSSGLAFGVRDPIRGTEPDDGIVINGLAFFLGAYLSGVASTAPFALGCGGSEEFVLFSLVPFGQWGVGLCRFTSNLAVVPGALFAAFELLGALIALGGLTHHRDTLSTSREAGTVSLTADGVQVLF